VKTGPASGAVRSYKRVSEKKLQNLMDVVACKSLKCDTAKAVSSASCSLSQSVSGASVVSDGYQCVCIWRNFWRVTHRFIWKHFWPGCYD